MEHTLLIYFLPVYMRFSDCTSFINEPCCSSLSSARMVYLYLEGLKAPIKQT